MRVYLLRIGHWASFYETLTGKWCFGSQKKGWPPPALFSRYRKAQLFTEGDTQYMALQ